MKKDCFINAAGKIIVSCVCSILICFAAESNPLTRIGTQTNITNTQAVTDTSISNQKDIRELIASALHIQIKQDSAKMSGKGPFVAAFPMVGYALQSGYLGFVSVSTSFYTSNDRNRFSNVLVNAYYSEYHQFWTIANSNIFFDKLKLHLFGDWRYYKYPTNTFGIGSNSTFADELKIDFSYIRFYQILYREIADNVFAGIGYNLDYHWNIAENPPEGDVYDEIRQYQNGNRSVSSGFSANFLYDSRKNSINPTGGSLVSIQYRPNMTFLGSDKNWQSLIIDLRQYFQFPTDTRNVLALWNYDSMTLKGDPPYFDLPSTGWDDYNNVGRGYVPGRYTGKNLLYAESEYRMVLTRNGLFGCVAFCNAESIFQKLTNNMDRIMPGGGFGIRLKINKYSNANLAVDYGFGVEGSRGFFFNLGEVF
jgi:Omp85 superfamily domain